ncbi:MAG TPA: bifunctional serine/threonine-protein kinase/formylglycine-generating enzyme family protein [Rhodanobacteraceae bacterium]|nr:bifunctional serine/threonine-protein kinase/formylglycine-generating enzyme family protein [Rhodanobacteraceae bacterium]
MNDATPHQLEVPGYRLVRPIGTSGVASVYEATQRSLERQVAIKLWRPLDDNALGRFEQLLRTNARLSHPNIVGIHQIGRTEDGRLFHSMPFLLSIGLSAHNLRFKPLKVAGLLRALLDALGHAHRRGIVHGGIKASNVLMDQRGHVRLADFGIARCAAELGLRHASAAAYLSPEQARGEPPGQRSDLYSIGILAFELLTGAPPFQGGDAVSTAIAHVEQPIPRLPPLVGGWQAWIDKALAKSPEQRFQGAQEMADALSAIDGRRRIRPVAVPVGSRLRAPTWAIAGAAVGAALVLAVGAWATWRSFPRNDAATLPGPVVIAAKAATASLPASAPPAASTAPSTQDRAYALVKEADALRTRGRLFAPAGNNAADKYLAALALDPGNPAATAGIDAMLATLRQRLAAAWSDGNLDRTAAMLKRCDLLASHAGPVARRDWRTDREDFAEHVGDAVVAAADKRDIVRLAALKPLAQALPATYPAGFDLAVAERRAATPVAGDRMHDERGPTLVYVPASGGAPAFAIERVEVTRGDYAAFVRATHRPDSRCLEAYNPFSRLRHLSWQDPGFKQGDDHPVVCVSWNDAVAYAAWLSKETGQAYMLPSSGEWLRAAQGLPGATPCQLGNVDDTSRQSAMDNDRLSCNDGAARTAPVGHYLPSGAGVYDLYGNVSEWVADGSSGERVFRGLSWRDGGQGKPLARRGTADSDVGYTNVGFRVVRVIDDAHPAPPVARASR